jgi:hypothetical protein
MKIQRLIPFSPLVALAALICAAAPASAQSVLGTAGAFALLGGASVANNGGVGTIITNGDVGSPTVNGFPPGVVVNGAIIGAGPQLNTALNDLNTAITGLSGLAETANEDNVNLGGLTLAPGVYKFDGTGELSGALTLNANGQSNVYWVFQFGTSFTEDVDSSVTLINPGSNDGIFWVAETAAVTIDDNSSILGNYLAGTSVSFGVGDTGNGRALADAAVTVASSLTSNAQGEPGGGDYTGGLTYAPNGTTVVPVTVPEPAAFLWLAPLGAIGFAFWRRRSAGNKIAA